MPEESISNESNMRYNVEAASSIFAEYGSFIHTVIRCQVKNEAQADGIFQDFFLSIVCKPIPGGVNNIKSYLYRAITNDIIEATRRVEKYRVYRLKYADILNRSINKKIPENASVDVVEKKDHSIRKVAEKTKKKLVSTSYLIPRKYREAIVGDIMEDCNELRALGKSEWIIRLHLIWQLAIALIMLRPIAIMDAFKRIWSTK